MPTPHLAILTQPWLDLILDGHKTIETRISKIKLPPYQAVSVGDRVLMKQSGGAVKGTFDVAKVETFHSETALDAELFGTIYAKDGLKIFGRRDVADMYRDALQKKWCASKYATFMHVENVCRYDPVIPIQKKDPRAWVVLTDGLKPYLPSHNLLGCAYLP